MLEGGMFWTAIAGVLSVVVTVSVALWGLVQGLDVLEALHLRKLEKKKEVQKAREYLKDPQGYGKAQNSGEAYGYTQTTNTKW